MASIVDLSKLKTSWTKYDIVRVMEVIYNVETIERFKNKEVGIDEPILRSFLGIKDLSDPIPSYWLKIQNYPKEKKLFALFATIFTHGEIISEFADSYSNGNMKGVFEIESGKQYTNIRSALVESGAAEPSYRRAASVPYDFTPIFQNSEVGRLFKEVLLERVSRITKEELTDSFFYETCISNNFHTALSISAEQFKSWLEGASDIENRIIEKVEIANFYSIEEVTLDFNKSKEVYFLGENGDGKSLVLMGIYLAFNGNYISEKTDKEKTGKAIDIIKNNRSIRLSGQDDNGTKYDLNRAVYLENFFAYGTHRGRYAPDNSEAYGFMSLFNSDETLVDPVYWLKNQLLLEFEKRLDANNMIGETKSLPNSFPIDLLKKMFFDLLEKNVEIKIDASGVLFNEKGTDLLFEQLSEGYKSILIFVSDLLYRLNANAVDGQNTTDLKGIVLVDEIDLHLHPKWQRVLISKLRKLFPNIQFIFTTHSPTIIQGASEDAIMFRVYRNKEDGKTRVSEPYLRKDFDHLMMNTLMTSPLFGLSDSRMNTEDNNSNTSENYLLYRINKKLEQTLAIQKKEGKVFINDEEIDNLIQQIINEELGKKND